MEWAEFEIKGEPYNIKFGYDGIIIIFFTKIAILISVSALDPVDRDQTTYVLFTLNVSPASLHI